MKKLLVSGLIFLVLITACALAPAYKSLHLMQAAASGRPVLTRLVNQPDEAVLLHGAGADSARHYRSCNLVMSFFNSDVHMYEGHNAEANMTWVSLLGVTVVIAL